MYDSSVPNSIVESCEFRSFLEELDSRYPTPCHSALGEKSGRPFRSWGNPIVDTNVSTIQISIPKEPTFDKITETKIHNVIRFCKNTITKLKPNLNFFTKTTLVQG